MKLERREAKSNAKLDEMKGSGRFVFQNNTSGDLSLPRPTETGKKTVRKDEQFIGDSYYFKLMPQELRFIREVKSDDQRLITEQPPVITRGGQVEFVQPKENFNEEAESQQDVLLTESPIDGVKIIH